MGYFLNSLANLPVDGDVNFYIFAINGEFEEPLFQMIRENFAKIAASIGNNAVIAVGTQPRHFQDEVSRAYLGPDEASYFQLLPALLITNSHPDQLTDKSLRLLVPLRDAELRFGSWNTFFVLLSEYARGLNDNFLKRFKAREDYLTAANKIINVKPGLFGVSLNVNELVTWWQKRKAATAR